jgi:hypothetical protein
MATRCKRRSDRNASEGLVAVEHGDSPLPVIVSLAVHTDIGDGRRAGVI